MEPRSWQAKRYRMSTDLYGCDAERNYLMTFLAGKTRFERVAAGGIVASDVAALNAPIKDPIAHAYFEEFAKKRAA